MVTTTPAKSAYQLLSPIRATRPGRYRAVVEGRPLSGGLFLGILDVDRNTWLSTAYYWWGQHGYDTKRMAVSATLTGRTRIQVILANLSPTGVPSRWNVSRVQLVRVAA